MQNLSHKTYSFASFTIDLDRSCLRHDGQDIKLRPKSFDSLKYLIENRGRVVPKDELIQAVWPDSFVTDDSLVQCVRDIRRALDDHTQRYIKTVPRRGYIFEAEVVENEWGTKETIEIRPATGSKLDTEEEKQAVEQANVPAVEPASPTRSRWLSGIRKLRPWIFAAMLAAVGGLGGWYFRPKSTSPVWRAVPLTSYPGFERNPALSPDGTQVAFTWNGEKQDNFDIYVKLIGSGAPHRLTAHPAEDVSAAWSPDGRTIAFLRWQGGGRNELLLIPALGGSERKLADTLIVDYLDSRLPLAWSPDGRWLVVSHREREDPAEGLFLVSALTGEKRRLTQPPRGFRGDHMPAFSSDGRALAFSRLRGNAASEVFLLPLSTDFQAAGEARRLTRHDQWAANPVWTRNGRHILYIFAVFGGPSELRMINVSGSGRSEQVPLLEDSIGQLSLGHHHLVYSRSTQDTNIWHAEIPPLGSPPSRPRPLISSTYEDSQPQYSPDGKKIAFGSTRSGTREIWIADADGSNPVQLTSFAGSPVGLMNWSPDGQRLVFHARPEGQADLFTIPAAGGVPKRLTMDPSDDAVPSYSHDGRWIYFTSMRSGQLEVWKMPAEGGDATPITSGGGLRSLESLDGKTLYYTHLSHREGIWKVPVQGGQAERITGPLSDQPSFAVTAEGIFYSAAPDSRHQGSIQFLNFSTGQSRPVVVTDRPIGWGLSLSPDQRFVVFARVDQSGSDLMLIENFVVP